MNVGLSAPRYEKYALLYPLSSSLRQELCNYFAVVTNLCKAIILFVRKPFISQALSALRKPFDDEFGKFRTDLVRLGDAVRDEVSLAANQEQSLERKDNSLFRRTAGLFQQEVAHQLGEAREWRDLKLKSRFLSACSTYNHGTALNKARRKGKSNWLFDTDDYRAWKSLGSSAVLLCSGIVGAGKTVISSSVVEELVVTKPADVSVGYFFCRDDDYESLKAREIIGSLARQILSGVSAKLFNKANQDVGNTTLDTEQIASHLLRLLPPSKYYTFVLDGLDECKFEEASSFFEAFQSLLRSPTHIFKLFWTGRSDFVARVSQRFRTNFHVQISQAKSGPEISNFIEVALDEALENERLQLRDPRIIIKIRDALEREAHKM